MPTRFVADTNVIAYYVLRTRDFIAEVEAFWASGPNVMAPAHWLAELANVVWHTARITSTDAAIALERLESAARLPITSVPVPDLWRGALHRSLLTNMAVYDTLFIELAAQRGCPLATFDQAVLRAFPDIAARPRDLL